MTTYTWDQVAALKEAVARGVTRVGKGDEQVQYASLAEMRRQIAVMERELQSTSSASGSGLTVTYPQISRGL
ncbi:MAG: hypothetical protein AAF686_07595 [Pseudomonadota bacterium]